jgi:hypothetical protein
VLGELAIIEAHLMLEDYTYAVNLVVYLTLPLIPRQLLHESGFLIYCTFQVY